MLTPHKYPTGRADFESIIKEGFLYVDKTERMYEMIGSRKFVFLSRPRRFGKSLLVNTLCAYFEGKKELFKGLKLYDLEKDWNENKHHNIARRMIERGGRRDIFLGTRECQGYVEPCSFGEGDGAYDSVEELGFGLMLHGITYADEAYDEATKDKMTVRFWYPVMKRGVIDFIRPEECPVQKTVREMEMKHFGEGNFSGLSEFEEVR